MQNALSGTFILTTKSVPKVKKELYNFKRNDVPTENLTNAYVISYIFDRKYLIIIFQCLLCRSHPGLR